MVNAAKPNKGAAERASRLKGTDRREKILDAAADIILEDGVSHCSLDRVAVQAEVSKALVYKHFANREELLHALIQREYDYLRGRNLNLTPPGTPLYKVRDVYVRRNLKHMKTRGGLLRALTSDAGVLKLLGESALEQRRSVRRFYVRETIKAYGLPEDLAKVGVSMTIAALDGAEAHLKAGMDPDRVADFWLNFVFAGWAASAARYAHEAGGDEAGGDVIS